MALTLLTKDILTEERYPFRTPNPADTIDTIIAGLKDLENSIDSSQVDSTVDSLSTGGVFFSKRERPCFHIKLRDTKVKALKKFGTIIMPVEFGSLVYLCKYEYLDGGWFSEKSEQLANIKKKLDTIDEWMEYTFIQTLGDFIFLELLRKHDPNFQSNISAYNRYLKAE
jgi:hypothetical protein